jgi:hypothetical protein
MLLNLPSVPETEMADSPLASPATNSAFWPALPLAEWKDTCETLHMWTQIVGKVRMALTPPVNHWWHTTLYVSACGLTTSAVPYASGLFEIEFDFVRHQVVLRTSPGATKKMALAPRSVADFYRELMSALVQLGIDVKIWTMPQEVPDPIPFEQDQQHASYDPAYANRFWKILVASDAVFKEFRGRFLGKCSPVHFFWGSFDLAVTRFSGRPAPPRPGADPVTAEAYSHECCSLGFWPGSGDMKGPAYYSYSAPAPEGFAQARVHPGGYSSQLSEFLLDYEEVRNAASPLESLLSFAQTSYEAGANLGKWDRENLEKRG